MQNRARARDAAGLNVHFLFLIPQSFCATLCARRLLVLDKRHGLALINI
jgi:hypothetical protein